MTLTYGQGGRPLTCPYCHRNHIDTKEDQFPHKVHPCHTCKQEFKTPIACVGVRYEELDFGKHRSIVIVIVTDIEYEGTDAMGHPFECPGVAVMCTRCFDVQEVGGRSEESVARGCVMLREGCPWKDKNLYLTEAQDVERKAVNTAQRAAKRRADAAANVYHPIFGCRTCGHEFAIDKPKQTAQCTKCSSPDTKFLRIPEEEKQPARKQRKRITKPPDLG